VVSASRSVDARLMEVLRSTGEWDRHCSAIRRYLLLGQVREGSTEAGTQTHVARTPGGVASSARDYLWWGLIAMHDALIFNGSQNRKCSAVLHLLSAPSQSLT